MHVRFRFAALTLALCASPLVLSCADVGAGDCATALGIDDGASQGASVTGKLGDAPLALRLQTGARLAVPVRALERGTAVMFARPADTEAVPLVSQLNTRYRLTSAPYTVDTDGVALSEEITLTLPAASTRVRGTAMTVMHRAANAEETSWLPLETSEQLESEVTFRTRSLGVYALVQQLASGSSCAVGSWDHDGDSATECVAWSECAAGTYVSTAGSDSTNRVCTPCLDGTFSQTQNAASCQAVKTCDAGSFVARASSKISDRVCEACASGTFSARANAESCQPFSTCAAGIDPVLEGSVSMDRLCTGMSCGNGASIRILPPGACWEMTSRRASGATPTSAGSRPRSYWAQ